jgi:hypothetical protein
MAVIPGVEQHFGEFAITVDAIAGRLVILTGG